MPVTVTDVTGLNPNAPVTLKVQASRFPQLISGRVDRYLSNNTHDAQVGTFNTSRPDVPVGTPTQAADRKFLVWGFVLHSNDVPPTPYEVTAELYQNGHRVATLDVDGGSGSVGTTNVPFLARFRFA